jgi:hypothetical protein
LVAGRKHIGGRRCDGFGRCVCDRFGRYFGRGLGR